VSPKIVQTLWDKDAAGDATNDDDVVWCEDWATTQVAAG